MVKSSKLQLKSTMEKFKFKQPIDRPTRITRKSETLIDLVFTNRPERQKLIISSLAFQITI